MNMGVPIKNEPFLCIKCMLPIEIAIGLQFSRGQLLYPRGQLY